MARYEHLPIYKQAMDVAVYFEKIVAGFTRYHKYTLDSVLNSFDGYRCAQPNRRRLG